MFLIFENQNSNVDINYTPLLPSTGQNYTCSKKQASDHVTYPPCDLTLSLL